MEPRLSSSFSSRSKMRRTTRSQTTTALALSSSSTMNTSIILLSFFNQILNVHGNGYMFEPPSRTYIASSEDLTWPECVSSGDCGLDALIKFYDSDSHGQQQQQPPVPFVSQRTYLQGQMMEVRSRLTNQHKAGHVELRGCPLVVGTRSSSVSTNQEECFEAFTFEFVDDALFGMPQDPSYPERGYFWGGEAGRDSEFVMTFRIPNDLVGQEVIIQWKYVDASDCNPPGYAEYFSGHNSKDEKLPESFWSAANPDCTADKLAEADTYDEHYWNSAEVTIVSNSKENSKQQEQQEQHHDLLDRGSSTTATNLHETMRHTIQEDTASFPPPGYIVGLDDSQLVESNDRSVRVGGGMSGGGGEGWTNNNLRGSIMMMNKKEEGGNLLGGGGVLVQS